MWQCVRVRVRGACVSVFYKLPHCGIGQHQPQDVIGYILFTYPYLQSQGALKLGPMVCIAQRVHFWGKFMKPKFRGIPENMVKV